MNAQYTILILTSIEDEEDSCDHWSCPIVDEHKQVYDVEIKSFDSALALEEHLEALALSQWRITDPAYRLTRGKNVRRSQRKIEKVYGVKGDITAQGREWDLIVEAAKNVVELESIERYGKADDVLARLQEESEERGRELRKAQYLQLKKEFEDMGEE